MTALELRCLAGAASPEIGGCLSDLHRTPELRPATASPASAPNPAESLPGAGRAAGYLAVAFSAVEDADAGGDELASPEPMLQAG